MSSAHRNRLTVTGAVVIVMLVAGRAAQLVWNDTIVIWKVGSPWQGDVPASTLPAGFRDAARRVGFDVAVQAFPARDFAATFEDAVARNAAPDVIVFDNFGVMDGITTPRGRFEGIGKDPTRRSELIRVTGAFDSLLGPTRGWTYLFSLSPHHTVVRRLAFDLARCPDGFSSGPPQGDVGEVVSATATAYLAGDSAGVQAYADPDRLSIVTPTRAPATVDKVMLCGMWGNSRLSIVSTVGTYEGAAAIGQSRVVLVLRKPAARWQVLAVARDPLSTDAFVKKAPDIAGLLSSDTQSRAFPVPATLLSPPTGEYPRPVNGQRFGDFVWRSSPSEDVVVEIAEFAYNDDVRLIAMSPSSPGVPVRLSAGQLVSGTSWLWRVWSVARSGDVVFTDTRTFVH